MNRKKISQFELVVENDNFIVRDHRLHDVRILPGVTLLDTVYRLGKKVFGHPAFELNQVLFKQPIATHETFDQKIRVTFKAREDNDWQVQIQGRKVKDGRPVEPTWVEIMECGLSLQRAQDTERPAFDLQSFIDTTPQRWDVGQIYDLARSLDIWHGPFMKTFGTVYDRQNEILMALQLGELAEEFRDKFYAHPTFLDGATAAGSFVGGQSTGHSPDNTPYIPFAIRRFSVYQPFPRKIYVYSKASEPARPADEPPDLVTSDISIYDEKGRIIAEFNGLMTKRIREARLIRQLVRQNLVIEENTRELSGSGLLHSDKASIAWDTGDEQSTVTVNPAAVAGHDAISTAITRYLQQQMANILGQNAAEINPHTPFYELGLESTHLLALTKKLEKQCGLELYPTLLFEYTTMSELAEHLSQMEAVSTQQQFPQLILPGQNRQQATAEETKQIDSQPEIITIAPSRETTTSLPISSETQPAKRELTDDNKTDIAIVGLSGRYPMAETLAEFWENLKAGRDCITEIPAERWDWRRYYDADKHKPGKSYSKWGGFIDNVDKFDPLFFNISPREAEVMDPQERLFLEIAWQTLEDAGYTRQTLHQQLQGQVGVFVGVMWSEYQLYRHDRFSLSSIHSSIANRVSYYLNLQGPSLAVDTMCSSSLTSIHLACESIKRGECAAALAGGVNVSIHPNKYFYLSQGNFAASDGRCRSFGAGGDGYVPGEGVGAVLLKPLRQAKMDGDQIYGVIKGSSIKHGGKTGGYTVPNPVAQGQLVAETWQKSGVCPESISYVEAHGTGTALGDPIEIRGLSQAFGADYPAEYSCAIGSVKSNIGHLEAAAGIAGLTKVLLQMKYRQLVPSLHAKQLNPHIDFGATPFQVQQKLDEWKRPLIEREGEEREYPRRASISAFGAGGANAHLVVEEYRDQESGIRDQGSGIRDQELGVGPQLIVLSARSEEQLRAYAGKLLTFLDQSSAPYSTKQELSAAKLRPTIEQAVGEMVAEMMGVGPDEIEFQQPIDEYGLDPVQLSRLRTMVEEWYHCELPPSLFSEQISVERVVSHLVSLASDDQGKHQVSHQPELTLANFAHTLQVGREAMESRLAFVVHSGSEVQRKLSDYLNSRTENIYQGRLKANKEQLDLLTGGDEAKVLVERLLKGGKLEKLAQLWVSSVEVDWSLLYENEKPKRISLPTYPFARERYWAPKAEDEAENLKGLTGRSISEQTTPGIFYRTPDWQVKPLTKGEAETGTASVANTLLLVGLKPHMVETIATTFTQAEVIALDPTDVIDLTLKSWRQIKAIVEKKPKTTHQIVVAAPDTVESHLYVPLAALLKTARLEHPSLRGKVITVSNMEIDRLISLLDREMRSDDSQDVEVSYNEAGSRTVKGLRKVTVNSPAKIAYLKPGGVYWITGGLGGLGRIFARHLLDQGTNITVILTGRSALNEADQQSLAELSQGGSTAIYLPADISVLADVERVVQTIREQYGYLSGIIHSAGVIRDRLIINKTEAEIEAVLAPKVNGILNLDAATQAEKLDFMVFFSSITGVMGNIGQADYAMANAFLDSFAYYRQALVETGQRFGRTLSINWPLWAEGGMTVDDQTAAWLKQEIGLTALETSAGLAAFDAALGQMDISQLLVVSSDRQEIEADPRGKGRDRIVESHQPVASAAVEKDHLFQATETYLKTHLSAILKLPAVRIESDASWERYGLDSMMMLSLIRQLEQPFGELPKTLFFEYQTPAELAAYFVETYPTRLQQTLALTNGKVETLPNSLPAITADIAPNSSRKRGRQHLAAATTRPTASDKAEIIAIIGLGGRYPLAKDLAAFWENLKTGRNCIREIPPERWDYRLYYDPDKGDFNKTYGKWGGFIDDIDKFDPLFFNISSREAEIMDPQERLFLETVWATVEDAGYSHAALAQIRQVGVFVGAMNHHYPFVANDLTVAATLATSSDWQLANRVSFFFDFQGPSLTIDTACSSSLTAIYLACESIKQGECKMAVAGGVNLSLHPAKWIALSQTQLLSSQDRSTSLGDGDGYLPGEGVGAVLLKPLDQAIADRDQIYGVIKGGAINHGGKTASFTVPNPNAQADLIRQTFERIGIDPHTISYLEVAANGSALGDPIEIAGLTKAFQASSNGDKSWCPIGSVKSNIGHLEAASGISQLTKVLLQLKHQTLVPSINADPVNPYLQLEGSPFYIQQAVQPWPRPEIEQGGQRIEMPRRAAISSFGAGGSNAHLVVEEYQGSGIRDQDLGIREQPHLIVLSAKNEDRLRVHAAELLDFLEQQVDISLAEVAYTLRVGREAMAERLALVVEDKEEILLGLKAYLDDTNTDPPSVALFKGNSDQSKEEANILAEGQAGQMLIETSLAHRDWRKLAFLWIKGVPIPWEQLYGADHPRRVSLPTYPFERRRYWLTDSLLGGNGKPSPATFRITGETVIPFEVDATQTSRENIRNYLVRVLSYLLKTPAADLKPEKTFYDYGLDSIIGMQLRRRLEETFAIELTGREMLEHSTIKALVGHLANKLAASSLPTLQTNGKLPSMNGKALLRAEIPEVEHSVQWNKMPLSEGQKGLWLLQKLTPEMSAYNVPMALRIRQKVHSELWQQACSRLVARYPILQTVIQEEAGQPLQIIDQTQPLFFELEDMGHLPEGEVISYLKTKAQVPFDLESGPLLRIQLFTRSEAEYILLVTIHHIIVDGTSMLHLLRTLLQIYQALAAGSEPDLAAGEGSYYDFVTWEQELLAGDAGRRRRAFWQQQLSGELPFLSLPLDKPRPPIQHFKGETYSIPLEPDLTRKVRDLAKTQRLNLALVFLGLFKSLLYRYTGQTDLLIGIPTAGRPQRRFEETIGYFINMVVIRSRLDNTVSFLDYLKQLQVIMVEALDHGTYPFPRLVAELGVKPDPALSPLFQVAFAFQNFIRATDLKGLKDRALESLPFEVIDELQQVGEFDFELDIFEADETCLLTMKYNPDLFDRTTIERLMRHYLNLTAEIVAAPEKAISAYDLLSDDDRQQILVDWNDTRIDYPREKCIHHLVEEQTARTPDAVAVVFEDRTLTYRALNDQANQLAQHLRSLGVGPEVLVGICVERSLEMMVGLLGILKAGGTYIPLDPAFPPQRLAYILQDAGVTTLVTQQKLIDHLPEHAAQTVCLDTDWPTIAAPTVDNMAVEIAPEQGAYIIYTSGSTGHPKGVQIPHRAVVNFLTTMQRQPGLNRQDRLLAVTTLSFDIAVLELFLPLIVGAQVIIADHDTAADGRLLSDALTTSHATVMQATPVTWRMLLESGWAGDDRLKALCGGEALPRQLANRLRESVGELWNMYGPTETTIWSTLHLVTAGNGSVPIGRPIANTQIYVLDKQLQPVPIGVPGVLYIGGDGLARGYHHRPDLTREKFVDNPFHFGTRMYNTGDLARWLPDGTVEFLGRIDHQVKIRGFRIELGEIETLLNHHPRVESCVVVAREDAPSDKRLVAYFLAEPAADDDDAASIEGDSQTLATELQHDLKQHLPDYMVPAAFVQLDAFPLTPNGKIDRRALPAPEWQAKTTYAPPQTALQVSLAALWAEVLGVEPIGIHHDFFELGGHSLLATQLIAKIRTTFQVDLTLRTLFETPTIAAIADIIEQSSPIKVAEVNSPGTRLPKEAFKQTVSSQLLPPHLISLQTEGERLPLFLVHPVAGVVFPYYELARQLGTEQPVYGLQAVGIAGEADPLTRIETMAERYLETIRQVQPEGPYQLAGWSFGGLVALELAQQLHRADQTVGLLAIIDMPLTVSTLGASKLFLTTILPYLWPYVSDYLAQRSNLLPTKKPERQPSWLARKLGMLYQKNEERGESPRLNFKAPEVQGMLRILRANSQAGYRYKPERYPGQVTLFKSTTDHPSATWGWGDIAAGGVELHSILGHHMNVLRSPQVEVLAEKLSACLAQPDGAATPSRLR